MASTRELKDRIKSVQDTKKITNAMYLISSTKMRRAKADLDATRPYFEALRTEVKRIIRSLKDIESKYVYPPNMDDFVNGTYGIILITSDKGLAGAYNQNAVREALTIIDEHRDVKLFVVGDFGKNYFEKRSIKIERDFDFSAEQPSLDEARDIAVEVLDQYDRGELKKVFLIYSNLVNSFEVTANSMRLLPFHRDYFDDKKKEKESEVQKPFEFYPSLETILDPLIESYITGVIYGALVDSYTSEQNSRMNAMSSANENAQDLLDKLSLEFNRIRQTSITNEIIEISAGAKAQRDLNKR